MRKRFLSAGIWPWVPPRGGNDMVPQAVPAIETHTPLEFKEGYQENVDALDKLWRSFGQERNEARTAESPYLRYAFQTLFAAIAAENTLFYLLNDEHVHCPLAWDPETGFPSHPSIVADVQKYVESGYAECHARRNMLEAFVGWSPVAREKMSCACGRTFREIELEIVIRNLFRRSPQGLALVQYVGVRSDDKIHLAKHYESGVLIEGLRAIVTVESVWRVADEEYGDFGLVHAVVKCECDKHFDFPLFTERLCETKESYDGK